MFHRKLSAIVGFVILMTVGGVFGRPALDNSRPSRSATALAPEYGVAEHNVGRLAISVSNRGQLGTGFVWGGNIDYFTGQPVQSCEYPIGSNTVYLFGGGLWVGAVIGSDTLVSTGIDGWVPGGQEFHPDDPPMGNMIYRSTVDTSLEMDTLAVSHQDYISVYYDTCHSCSGVEPDEIDLRPHIPLNIRVTQSSYAWSYRYAEDFILMDFTIENLGGQSLQDVYLGIYADADIHGQAHPSGYDDDLCGFRESVPALYLPQQCLDDFPVIPEHTVNLAYAHDNDGDLNQVAYPIVPHTTGIRVIRTPSDSAQVSFNWWKSNGDPSRDFGPQTQAGYRDFGSGRTGTPAGDRNKYFLLRNGESDYDQVRTATIDSLDPIWMYPPQIIASPTATGSDTRYLLSVGPFDIEPGEKLPLTLAYLGGEDLHQSADNLQHLPLDPDSYTDGLDFNDLALNAVWADWIYDNPGVDTDSDGYAGQFIVCDLGGGAFDTVFTKGDGVPDFSAASPPVAPPVWIEPQVDGFTMRWNGHVSETGRDVFGREQDFEGYNAYVSTDGGVSNYTLAASYDIEDYLKSYWTGSAWSTVGRYDVEELKCSYAPNGCVDTNWNPTQYPATNPLVWTGPPDSMFYFEPVGANLSEFGIETPIVKRFPAATEPIWSHPDSVPVDQRPLHLTDDGYFKYYEYELDITQLLSGTSYWLAVTAFDYGSLAMGVPSQETPIYSVVEEATTETPTAVEPGTGGQLPASLTLHQNYPNPFNPTTEISFTLPERAAVTLEVFNISGQKVATLLDKSLPPGDHSVTWDAGESASGVYLYRLTAGNLVAARKMVVMK